MLPPRGHHNSQQQWQRGMLVVKVATALNIPISNSAGVRLIFLHALWCTHQDPELATRTSNGVVAAAVQQLQQQIWAQFKVAAVAEEDINALSTRLLTADLKPTQLQDFESTWALNGVLCVVDRSAGGQCALRMRLSMTHPTPAPGPGGHEQ